MEFLKQLIHTLTLVHPLHPMFVHFPIALTSAALFFILLALWKRSDQFEKTAFANISLSAVSVLVAGVSGFYDNLVNYGGGAANYKVKIVLAVVLLISTSATALIRWRYPQIFHQTHRYWYVAAYFFSFAIAIVLAFLGGVIVYGFG